MNALSCLSRRALGEAAEAQLRGEDATTAATVATTRGDSVGARFGGVEGAMVGINSVHVALSSVSAIQVRCGCSSVSAAEYDSGTWRARLSGGRDVRCLKTKEASIGGVLHPLGHSVVVYNTDSESNLLRQRCASASQGTYTFISLSYSGTPFL